MHPFGADTAMCCEEGRDVALPYLHLVWLFNTVQRWWSADVAFLLRRVAISKEVASRHVPRVKMKCDYAFNIMIAHHMLVVSGR